MKNLRFKNFSLIVIAIISLLHSLGIEAYFVLVPHHIFVIVSIEDERLSQINGLWVEGKKYYILESTATGSKIGFPLGYGLLQIEAIVEPFINVKRDLKGLKYKP